MSDFSEIAYEVFASRMGGPLLPEEYTEAFGNWVDRLPAPARRSAADPLAVQRGEELFHSDETGCASCHGGARSNETVDVGTGGLFQVPSLVGVASRAPFMHNGCAPTLLDRFGECGGDAHGQTSQLDAEQIDDLVQYMTTM